MNTNKRFPKNWYWKKQDGTIYSSGDQGFVDADDAGYLEFLADGIYPSAYPVDDAAERNDSDEEMEKVLAGYGLEMFAPTPEELLSRAKAEKKAAIDANTNLLIERDGLLYQGKHFAMTQGAKINWNSMAAMKDALPYPTAIITMDDQIFPIADQAALMQFLSAAMLFETTDQNSPAVSGRILRMQVEAATTVGEVNAIIDDRQ